MEEGLLALLGPLECRLFLQESEEWECMLCRFLYDAREQGERVVQDLYGFFRAWRVELGECPPFFEVGFDSPLS